MSCGCTTSHDALSAFIRDEAQDRLDADRAGLPGRDEAVVSRACAAGAGLRRKLPAPYTGRAAGGALRRLAVPFPPLPARQDENYVPLGFARYRNPGVDPGIYTYYQMAGWRIAVPRALCKEQALALVNGIYEVGPGPWGYARLGDTLVPAGLSPGDRQTLAQTVAGRGYPLVA